MKEETKIPNFWVPILISGVITVSCFYGVFSVARADVGNLKAENVQMKSDLKALSEAVPALQADMKTVKDSQAEMRQDIKTLLQRGHQ